ELSNFWPFAPFEPARVMHDADLAGLRRGTIADLAVPQRMMGGTMPMACCADIVRGQATRSPRHDGAGGEGEPMTNSHAARTAISALEALTTDVLKVNDDAMPHLTGCKSLPSNVASVSRARKSGAIQPKRFWRIRISNNSPRNSSETRSKTRGKASHIAGSHRVLRRQSCSASASDAIMEDGENQ